MSKVTRVMLMSVIVNIGLSFFKIVVGFIGKSQALLADGIHSFSDLMTDGVAIFGDTMSRKPADEKHPYGHGKAEYITSMAIGLVILGLGFSILASSIQKEISRPTLLVVVVSFCAIVIKFLLSRYLLKKGEEYQNNILMTSGSESSTDVLSAFVVLVSSIIMQFAGDSIFKYADLCASMIVGILIVKVGFDILKQNISTTLGEQETDPAYLKEIKQCMEEDVRIAKIDKLVLLKFGPYDKLIGEVSMDSRIPLYESHMVLDELEEKIKAFDERIQYITIHINPCYVEESNPTIPYQLKDATEEDLLFLIENKKNGLEKYRLFDGKSKKNVKALKQVVQKNLCHVKMLEAEGEKIGYIGMIPFEEGYLVEDLYIHSDYRNLGIASHLLNSFVKKARLENKWLRVWIYNENKRVIHLYERLGFEVIKRMKSKYLMEWKELSD